KIRKEEF
ncbi:hypothetical protein EUTSA_v100020581mg, partial [Eutrema salsugineum]